MDNKIDFEVNTMKAIITGKIECLKCAWTGEKNELTHDENGEKLSCPECNHVLIDFSNGNFVIDHVKAETLTFE